MKLILTLMCLNCLLLLGQNKTNTHLNIHRFNAVFELEDNHLHWDFSKNNKNEIEFLFATLFLGYKHFISSQDAQDCSFHPTCSEYALQSIKKKGVVIGMMDTGDRLLRCNGGNCAQYKLDKKRNKYLDPID